MNTSALDYIKFYVDKGWYIFPCKPHDKFPLFPAAHEKGNPCKGECGKVGHGLHDATKDINVLKEWWKQYPSANVGLATGEHSGIFALDVDAGHGGFETLEKHIKQYGDLPNTPISNTGGGGRHYFFNWEKDVEIRNSAGKLGLGLDVRGNGGYVVAPLSIHPNGKMYEWDRDHRPSEIKTAPAPVWIYELLAQKPAPGTGIQTTDGAYIAGQRNSALTSLAGSMRRRGMDEESIFLALNAENLNKCVPPLSDGEIRNIAKSVIRYNPTAAPELQPRDRVTAEWAFCKTVFEVPDYVPDHISIHPDFFSVRQLADFWKDVLDGTGVALAAVNCEILADLENYQEWFLPRLDTYADTIKKYAHRDRAAKLGWKLQKAAETGDMEGIDRAVIEINQRVSLQTNSRIVAILDAADSVEADIEARSKNPAKVWGIPYAWEYLSDLTGGKQLGELILLAGEPKIGKSYLALQDALCTAIDHAVPTYVWSGEMGAKQVTRRAYQLLGVNADNMRSGYMTDEDWEALKNARALLLNSPLFIDDKPLNLHELRGVLQHEKTEHGIKHFVLDYAFLINAPGKDEIEKTNNVSRTLKQVCRELDLSGVLITSVNKSGMDTGKAMKANVRGSGQQIHDADLIYFLTEFAPIENDNVKMRFSPSQYERLATLHIVAGRELNPKLPGGILHFSRLEGSPRFKQELQKGFMP